MGREERSGKLKRDKQDKANERRRAGRKRRREKGVGEGG